jgi:uncharacterized repeat protein (TIGR03803 family)
MKTQIMTLENVNNAMTEHTLGRELVLALLVRLFWLTVLMLPTFCAKAGAVLTTLHSFTDSPNGWDAYAGLVQGGDGYFYGTTWVGGMHGWGSVFKIDTNGALTSLYSFTGGNDGGQLRSGLVQGSDGFFYGTTEYGGASGFGYNGFGTVFRISTNGALTTLYSFTGANDGARPFAGLGQGSDGYFYGTTVFGGTNKAGTIFRISTNGALTSLYSYDNGGGVPRTGLVQGSDGYFYGTIEYSGMHGWGSVFKITTNGVLTSLYSFTGTNDGANPFAGLVQGSDGYFYGTTDYGGTNKAGTVFRISTNGALTSLYSFTGTNDGAQPQSRLVQGTDGYFYGTTQYGGASTNQYGQGQGTVFKIDTNGALTTLWSFTGGNTGAYPTAGLVQGRDGNFYGTTSGGTPSLSTVFQISATGALTTLYAFTGGNDGSYPQAGLVKGSDGYFYGTTRYGGTNRTGSVFRIGTDGALTNLYFFTGANDGANPLAGLVQGSDGYFYGTTESGGTTNFNIDSENFGNGTVFKISTNGVLTSLHSFTGTNDGAQPQSRLVQGNDGYFYGTTYYGGAYTNQYGQGQGTVFKIDTNGALTTLWSFTGGNDGAMPKGLVEGSDGYFYGTTVFGGRYDWGAVFRISTNGALTRLYSFTGGNDGAIPTGLVQGCDGYFYGTTGFGGTYGDGNVFRISTNHALTTLYSFTGGNDGRGPAAGLVQGSDGYFYGTTDYGGTYTNYGTVFRISTNGALTSLYSFTGINDGEGPEAELVQGNDGNFYGCTVDSGLGGAGTIFRLTIMPEFQVVTLTNNVLSMTWSTEAGGTYQLQYNSDLSSSNWINLYSAFTATGGMFSATDSLTNAPQRFYRVVSQ